MSQCTMLRNKCVSSWYLKLEQMSKLIIGGKLLPFLKMALATNA